MQTVPTFLSSGNEVEFHVPYRNSIPFLTAHLHKLLDDAPKTQYLLEILHGVGVVEYDVSAKHIHESANDDVHTVLVDEDFKAQIVVRLVLKFFFGTNGFYERQGVKHLEYPFDEFSRAFARNGGDGENFVFPAVFFLKCLIELLTLTIPFTPITPAQALLV